jgi:Zn-dependent peptidase ImmA (M78 family)/transcriptional regulator with XRE-family HTH domain
MSSTNLAYITPELITWAINRSGISYTRLEKSLGVNRNEIIEWEQGDSQPPFNKAVELATALRIPFGYLFLNSPPSIEIPLPDLRTLPQSEPNEPSVDFLELLYSVLAKQEWYREYAEEHGAEKLAFVSSYNINDDPKRVASNIGEILAFNGLRETADSWSDYLTLLSASAESAGILVMRSGVVGNDTTRALSVKEFQGFAITDEIAPLVFVNSRDYRSAQIFTLAHELAHIWVGTSGISNPDETDTVKGNNRVEEFCNDVAVEVLVPEFEFQRIWRERIPLQTLARHFWVSSFVILRRAYELKKISRSEFFILLEQERAKLKTAQPTGGNYYRNLLARHGARFTDALIEDVRRGGTVFRDAARLLNLKVPTLVKFMGSER